MRLLDRQMRVSPAFLLRAFGCALGTLPLVVAAQPWSPLVRESRAGATADVFFEAQSIREIDPGVFEIRLMYEPVAWVCVRPDRDGVCDVDPDRFFWYKKIRVIRIRCRDMSFEESGVWIVEPIGSWRQLPLMEFEHPPGWRYGIAPSTAEAAARDLVCTTVPP